MEGFWKEIHNKTCILSQCYCYNVRRKGLDAQSPVRYRSPGRKYWWPGLGRWAMEMQRSEWIGEMLGSRIYRTRHLTRWRKKGREKKELKLFPDSSLHNWVDGKSLKKSRRVGFILWVLLILLNNWVDEHKEHKRRSKFSRGVMAKSVIDMLSAYETFRRSWKNTGRCRHLDKEIVLNWKYRFLLETKGVEEIIQEGS